MKGFLKQITPRQISHFIARLDRFYAAGSPDRFPSQEGAFFTLKKLGWNPSSCIDVGAYHGDWAKMFLSIFPTAKVLMIEAQESKKTILQKAVSDSKGKLACKMSLLGSTDGQMVSFVEMETGSSVFEESSPYQRVKKIKSLTTLDSLLLGQPDFESAEVLKIDTQGYELEILKGCPKLLEKLEVVLLEISLIETNKGAPTFEKVIAFMSSAGFVAFDFCSQIRRADGILWQTDMLFIRRNGRINVPIELGEDNWC